MTPLFSRQGVTLTASENTLDVSGNLGTGVAAGLADAGIQWLERDAAGALVLDFSGVESASSAAISVLLQWLRTCGQTGVTVEGIRLSEPLHRLASLAEVDALLEESSPRRP